MSRSAQQQRHKDQVALGAAALALLAGALIWLLWVMPITRSVAEASPAPLGEPLSVELAAGERVGIWASGLSAAFGAIECTVTGPDGDPLPQRGAPSLNWDDTLWWTNPRPGFEQVSQVVAVDEGRHTVDCRDSLGQYGGEILVAGDTFGAGDVGLGRTGSADFAIGTVLAFCAVVCPLFALLLPVIIVVRRLSERLRTVRD